MVVQGFTLSYLYAFAPINHSSPLSAVSLVGLLAILHWSVHVLAAMAKNDRLRSWNYVRFETLFLALQFGVFAALISTIVY